MVSGAPIFSQPHKYGRLWQHLHVKVSCRKSAEVRHDRYLETRCRENLTPVCTSERKIVPSTDDDCLVQKQLVWPFPSKADLVWVLQKPSMGRPTTIDLDLAQRLVQKTRLGEH